MSRRMANALPVMGAALVALISLGVSAWHRTPAVYEETVFELDTFVQFKVVHPRAEELVTTAVATLDEVEDRLNRYDSESAVARVQAAAGDWVEVDGVTAEAFRLARSWGERTGGAFDVTLGSVADLYDFGGVGRVPSAGELAEAMAHAGVAAWELEGAAAGGAGTFPTRVRLVDSKAVLDLGGLHKGLAVDLAAAGLREAGVKHGLIDVGSNMVAIGPRPDGKPWRIGIAHPRAPGQIVATVALQDDAVSTSGDYQQGFDVGGVRYHHIIDPRTGSPATGWSGNAMPRLAAVTVLAPTAAEADILSTALFVMGLAVGQAWLEANPEYGAVFVTEAAEVILSPGLAGRVEVLP
ncbi:MAG: thiamine biosynthesis protein ApbE [Symbiobacteriaceae bacterium]|nr:thiamine biosynthesis protein ApbE [Symbiobacteriaceae bacterium]